MSEHIAPSRGIRRDPALAGLLGGRVAPIWFTWPRPGRTVIGWGRKRSGRRAQKMAKRSGADLLLLEDGFLRSVARDDPRIGINFDSRGVHYDAASRSRLFDLIARPLDASEEERARAIMEQWRALRLSKYNDLRPYAGDLGEDYVLVVDQVRDDLSIAGGKADADAFERMLDAALAEHPGREIVVKLHPDAHADPRKRHFSPDALATRDRVSVLTDRCDVVGLIERAAAVYTVTSQVGFEALMWAKPVRCFGMPFYAGWGLTDDALDAPEGRGTASLEALVHAALVDYPRYWHPVRRAECSPEDAMALVGLNKALRNALPEWLAAFDFSPWKKPFIRQFLTGSAVRFTGDPDSLAADEGVVLWGRKPVPEGLEDRPAFWIEDGFLRSVGLGADLVRPLSLVVDGPGIYYDATRASGLETYLVTHDWTDAERARAKALRDTIIGMRLTKYNLEGQGWTRPATDRPVLLVVGQVADDQSMKLGSPDLKTSGALLKRVRAENPRSYILYKPHPDVVAALREGGADDRDAAALADEIVADVDPLALIDAVDEVHVMTSLMGFEALMRGRKVVCHGLPFYAGWGLTEDRLGCERRSRTLLLDELVDAALIAYPRYFDEASGLFAAPEDMLAKLTEPGTSLKSRGRKWLRPFFRLAKAWRERS